VCRRASRGRSGGCASSGDVVRGGQRGSRIAAAKSGWMRCAGFRPPASTLPPSLRAQNVPRA
jgi:hypothetical protein